MGADKADRERELAIVDIDGVIADVRHRLHYIEQRPKDWKRFFAAAADDDAHEEGLAIVTRLAAEHEVVFLTGRPRHLERATREWLARVGLGDHQLEMRPEGDYRPAAVVKTEQLRKLAGRRRVAIVVDDDPVVLAAMAKAGYPTFHADWERRRPGDEAALRQAQESDGRT